MEERKVLVTNVARQYIKKQMNIKEEDFKDYLEIDLFKESIEYNKSKYNLKELIMEINDMDDIIINRKGYEVAFLIESNIDFDRRKINEKNVNQRSNGLFRNRSKYILYLS